MEHKDEFYAMLDAREDKDDIIAKFENEEEWQEAFFNDREVFSISGMWGSVVEKQAVIDIFMTVPEFKEWMEKLPEAKKKE